MRIVTEQGESLVDDPAWLAGVSDLGVGGTAYLRARGTIPTLFTTGITDLSP